MHTSKRYRAYKANYPLIIGSVLVLSVLFIAILGSVLAPRDPYLKSGLRFSEGPDGTVFTAPPFPPSAEFLLGSDHLGRDMLSRILYAVRSALIMALAVSSLRLVLAVPLGLLAGWYRGVLEAITRQFAAVFGAVPSLLLSFVALKIIFVPAVSGRPGNMLTLTDSVVLFIGVLALVEWPRLADQVRSRVTEIAGEPFIEGAISAGAGSARIIFRHILPQLGPEIVVMSALEISRALLLVARLGLFGIYIGGGVYEEIMPDYWIQATLYPELGSMISDVRRYLRTAPWMIIWPALTFFWIIGSFNLLAEGLRVSMHRFSERGSIARLWNALVNFFRSRWHPVRSA